MKRCVQCQNELPDPAAHCVYCGSRQPAVAAASPVAKTVMGYPGMANDLARATGQPGPQSAGGKPNRANAVSGFDATQPLTNDQFRAAGGQAPGGHHGAGTDPFGLPPGLASTPRQPQGQGDPGRGAGQPYPGAPGGHGPGPGPGAGFGPPAGQGRPPGALPSPGFSNQPYPGAGPGNDPGFGPRPESQPAQPQGYGPQGRQGSQPQSYGQDPGFGPRQRSEPQAQPQGFGPQGHDGSGFGPRPGSQPQGYPPDAYGARPGSQPQGYPPDPGYGARPGSQPQGYPPDGGRPGSQPQGFGAPPGYGPQGYAPPPGGFAPGQHGPGGHPPPHAYGAPPPMGFHQQRPETELVAPLRPPYLASETGRRASSPAEPWGESLKTLMLVFGVLLVACFVAPWQVQPGATTFSWSILTSDASTSAKVVPLLFVATGVLSILLGALPLAALVRGFAAAGIGLAPIVYQAIAPAFDWRQLVALIGAVTLVSGLLVRSQYTGALAGRLLATIGAICALLPLLIPVGDAVPLVQMFKLLGQGTGQMKVAAIIALVPVVIAVLALLVWLPAPGRAGAHILAWTLIVWPLVASIAAWLLAGELGANLKSNLYGILYMPMAAMAWAGLTGYGVATITGKQLEHA